MMTHPITLIRAVCAGVGVMVFGMALGCASAPVENLADIRKPAPDFLIGPEDVLDITVWRNADLSKTVTVRPDGMISLPLIGDLRANGITAAQLAEKIAVKLKEFKESPTVAVSVKEINSYNIYVVGEVTKPGKYPLKSHTTLLQAISIAGGFTPFASKNKLQVVRNSTGADGESRENRIPVRYDDLLAGKGEPGNFVLRSGDTVVVP
ncbi:MAG: sugar ABC transporter substrate-binding protein [Nitrospira sp.]|nr:MAG: sugar ABC transporter substrate-binding protein [Nitrospira sp.]